MTPKNFRRMENLGAETIRIKNKLERIKNGSTIPATNYASTSGRAGTGDSVSWAVCQKDELQRQMQSARDELQEIILTEERADIRKLLTCRFVQLLSWTKVAEQLNYVDGSAVYKKFKRYKRKMDMDKDI